jgi:hypothetical protein
MASSLVLLSRRNGLLDVNLETGKVILDLWLKGLDEINVYGVAAAGFHTDAAAETLLGYCCPFFSKSDCVLRTHMNAGSAQTAVLVYMGLPPDAAEPAFYVTG